MHTLFPWHTQRCLCLILAHHPNLKYLPSVSVYNNAHSCISGLRLGTDGLLLCLGPWVYTCQSLNQQQCSPLIIITKVNISLVTKQMNFYRSGQDVITAQLQANQIISIHIMYKNNSSRWFKAIGCVPNNSPKHSGSA